MHYLVLPVCSCRNELGEPTPLGELHRKLEQFKEAHPKANITEFFDREGIMKMCHRLHLATPYHIRLESANGDSDTFIANERYTQDLSHLIIKPNVELDWP